MPTLGGRRHWPEKSGYLDSSNAWAPAIGNDSAVARVSAAIALRLSIFIPLVLFEMPQVRTRLPLLGGPDQAVLADEVVLLADANVPVVFFTIVLKPDRVVALAAIILNDRPGTRLRAIVARDLVLQNVRIGAVEIEPFLEDCFIVGVERNAAGLVGVGTLEVARFDFQHVEATVAILVDPLADRIAEEIRLLVLGPLTTVGVNAARGGIVGQDVGGVRRDDDFHGKNC